MDSDDDSITLSMDEYAKLQNDILDVKHENTRLKEISEKYDEAVKKAQDSHNDFQKVLDELQKTKDELNRLKSPEEDPLKKIPRFSREMIVNCLKSVRKQDDFDKDQSYFLEQILAIIEYIWPKGGDQELKISDIQEVANASEVKNIRESYNKIKFSLEAMEEKSKVMQISLEETAKDNLKMSQKITELEGQKEHLIIDLASREEEVVEARKQLKDKFALECEKHNIELELESSKGQIEKLKNELEKSTEKESNAELIIALQQEIEELKNNENLLSLEYNNLKNSAKQTFYEIGTLKTSNKTLESTVKSKEEQLKKIILELEDMKTERQILQKRSMNDLKDLKTELAKEKTLHEQCKMDKEKVMQENRKLQENLRAGVKIAPPSHQERIIVESMSHRLSELDQENTLLKKRIKDFANFGNEKARLEEENDDLKNEINKLAMEMASIGAQFNEYRRLYH
ncbi:hypothetical protein SteCoe_25682 [Stentor coeruleus]|uniref:Uncharacterized protein n=1 Tax=Stentor coeruleus TaxID=5963 RepID=A0A1R2BEU5_9CILI|nr:hypothetical protein SteCoe_25682 [Stentor coeruleus]